MSHDLTLPFTGATFVHGLSTFHLQRLSCLRLVSLRVTSPESLILVCYLAVGMWGFSPCNIISFCHSPEQRLSIFYLQVLSCLPFFLFSCYIPRISYSSLLPCNWSLGGSPLVTQSHSPVHLSNVYLSFISRFFPASLFFSFHVTSPESRILFCYLAIGVWGVLFLLHNLTLPFT